MNRLNKMIRFDRWCIGACERMGSPHLMSVEDLETDMAIRDAVRYRGIGKRIVDEEYLTHKFEEQSDAHLKFWMSMLEVKE